MESRLTQPILPPAQDLFGDKPTFTREQLAPSRFYGERGSAEYAAYVQSFLDRAGLSWAGI